MFKTILVPIDLDDEASSEKALGKAAGMAHAFGSQLVLMNVVPDFGMAMVAQYFPRDYEQKIMDDARDRLQALARERLPSDLQAEVEVSHGRAYDEILRVAKARGCDLILMASHRPEFRDYLLGPNAARVVRHAECSVLVIRE